MRLTVFALLAAILVPVASAASWTRITPDSLSNHADPSVLLTDAGVLIAYDVQSTGTLDVVRGSGAPQPVVSGWAAVSDPQLVRKPDGKLYLYMGGSTPDLKTAGALRFDSANGGAAWSGPVTTNPVSTIGDIQASALRGDGTPLFSQDGTGFINVYQGDSGQSEHNAFSPCCGYYESLAVDSSGLGQLGFWSNAASKPGYLYEILDASGSPAGQPVDLAAGTDAQASPSINRVPLVADGRGNTFMAWPGAGHVTIAVLGGGQLRRRFSIQTGPNPAQVALAVEPDGAKLWVLWTQGGSLWATRLRDAAHGAAPIVVRAKLPGGRTPYALEAVGLAGQAQAVLNLGETGGNALWQSM